MSNPETIGTHTHQDHQHCDPCDALATLEALENAMHAVQRAEQQGMPVGNSSAVWTFVMRFYDEQCKCEACHEERKQQ
jgi:hypothetical protein